MKNRAKCKLCHSIIESFHSTDYVMCKCGEIAVDGGDGLKCYAKDWGNFLRVDDQGNEIIVKIEDTQSKSPLDGQFKPTRKELLDMLQEMINNYERLPPEVLSSSPTNYDLVSSLMLLLSILRSE